MTKPKLSSSKESGKSEGNDEEKTEKAEMVGLLDLFKYADKNDILLMIFGSLAAACSGASYPVTTIVFGECMGKLANNARLEYLLDDSGEFLDYANLTKGGVLKDPNRLRVQCADLDTFYNTSNLCGDTNMDEPLTDAIEKYLIYYVLIGLSVVITGTLQVLCWNQAAERQGLRIRYLFFKSILRQDIGWFDCNDSGMLNSYLSNDINKIQRGLGETVGVVIFNWTAFIIGYIVGFWMLPKLAAVLVASSPAMVLAGAVYAYLASSMTSKEQAAYARAGSVAEEVLSSIKTVAAFGGEEKEAVRYELNLGEAQKYGLRKGISHGFSIGLFHMVNFFTYALGLWYGGKLIRDDDESLKDVLTAYFTITLGTFCLGTAVPGFQNVAEARGAAFNVYKLIDMKSKIDSFSPDGKKPTTVHGSIRFKDVHFTYPARLETKILQDFNLDIRPGQTVALVGSSGCGKSTTVQLLLRFYDPDRGQITIDGHDLKDLNVKWIRQNVGLVSQEPILFDTTIEENIRYGREDVTMDEIVQAAKNANAHDFISQLPQKFKTLVGERGAQLSGGQKQRIAIARALVRDPKILLLDEATSALDTESESVVQDALDKARRGRTTLIIAHRLSTIQNADIIVGIENGIVKEKGTHNELMNMESIYSTLVMNQTHEEEQNEEHRSTTRPLSNESAPQRARAMSVGSNASMDDEEYVEDLPEVGIGRLLQQNKSEWYFMVLGCIGAIIFGSCQPCFAMVFSEILKVFEKDKDDQKDDVRKWSLALVAVGFAALFGAVIQSWMLSIAGEALTKRLRTKTFRAMLRQDMAWFDVPHNSTGALTSHLSSDAGKVQEASGVHLGMLFQCFVAIAGAIILSFVYGWQLTFVILGFFPFLLLAGIMQIRLVSGDMGSNKDALEASGKVAVESIVNMRTVASLTKEETFLEEYIENFKQLKGNNIRKTFILGVAFAFSQAVIFFAVCIIFSYGTYLIEEEEMSTNDLYKVFSLIMFCGIFLGQAAAFGPDIGKAKKAAKKIFAVIDREPKIDTLSPDGKKPDRDTFYGDIKFREARFHYPTRPNVKVLKSIDFSVESGQTVALVGNSGCGKSTTVALLERFYDLEGGFLTLDKHEIRDLNIKWLRSQIGLVSQEPVLFDSSIAENIAYGDNSREVKMEEIIKAARSANIHNFIDALPHGYDTNVGEKGTQLSGGQKQRVAIARALVRNPKILLLDEATSALDTESEKIVQDALDKARRGRTCVTIAHRLSTIQDADKIVVIQEGQVVEQGTHAELMSLKGFYYRLQTIKNKTT